MFIVCIVRYSYDVQQKFWLLHMYLIYVMYVCCMMNRDVTRITLLDHVPETSGLIISWDTPSGWYDNDVTNHPWGWGNIFWIEGLGVAYMC